jgi:hypothetical protein
MFVRPNRTEVACPLVCPTTGISGGRRTETDRHLPNHDTSNARCRCAWGTICSKHGDLVHGGQRDMLSLDVSLRPRPGLPSGRVSGVGVRRELQQHGLARRAWLARNTVATENTEFASQGSRNNRSAAARALVTSSNARRKAAVRARLAPFSVAVMLSSFRIRSFADRLYLNLAAFGPPLRLPAPVP